MLGFLFFVFFNYSFFYFRRFLGRDVRIFIFLYIYCKLNLACFLGQNPVCLGAEVRFDTTPKIDMFEADMYLVNGL